jgi:hypothetical protein
MEEEKKMEEKKINTTVQLAVLFFLATDGSLIEHRLFERSSLCCHPCLICVPSVAKKPRPFPFVSFV